MCYMYVFLKYLVYICVLFRKYIVDKWNMDRIAEFLFI